MTTKLTPIPGDSGITINATSMLMADGKSDKTSGNHHIVWITHLGG